MAECDAGVVLWVAALRLVTAGSAEPSGGTIALNATHDGFLCTVRPAAGGMATFTGDNMVRLMSGVGMTAAGMPLPFACPDDLVTELGKDTEIAFHALTAIDRATVVRTSCKARAAVETRVAVAKGDPLRITVRGGAEVLCATAAMKIPAVVARSLLALNTLFAHKAPCVTLNTEALARWTARDAVVKNTTTSTQGKWSRGDDVRMVVDFGVVGGTSGGGQVDFFVNGVPCEGAFIAAVITELERACSIPAAIIARDFTLFVSVFVREAVFVAVASALNAWEVVSPLLPLVFTPESTFTTADFKNVASAAHATTASASAAATIVPTLPHMPPRHIAVGIEKFLIPMRAQQLRAAAGGTAKLLNAPAVHSDDDDSEFDPAKESSSSSSSSTDASTGSSSSGSGSSWSGKSRTTRDSHRRSRDARGRSHEKSRISGSRSGHRGSSSSSSASGSGERYSGSDARKGRRGSRGSRGSRTKCDNTSIEAEASVPAEVEVPFTGAPRDKDAAALVAAGRKRGAACLDVDVTRKKARNARRRLDSSSGNEDAE